MQRIRDVVTLLSLAGLVVSGGCFVLDRTDALEPGTVRGIATFGDVARAGATASLVVSCTGIWTPGRTKWRGNRIPSTS